MGLFNPESREEQAHSLYRENARFQEIKRENKRKSEVRLNLRFWSEWQDLNLRPLPPQGSALPTAPHPDKVLMRKRDARSMQQIPRVMTAEREMRDGHDVAMHIQQESLGL